MKEVTKPEELLELVRLYGSCTTDAVLDRDCHLFRVPSIEGFISYKLDNQVAVIFGDPIAPPSQRIELATFFYQFAEEHKYKVIYVVASESFAEKSRKVFGSAYIEFGEELLLNPMNNPMNLTGERASLLRRKVKHAIKEGVEVEPYLDYNEELEEKLLKVSDQWLQSRKGPQVHISHVDLFENRSGKRWFWAARKGQVVGVVVLNKLENFGGWLLNHLMVLPDAPHGTAELIVMRALESLEKEGCNKVTVGAVPGQELGKIVGLSKSSTWIARWGFKMAKKVFKLEGRKKFWEKFNPETRGSYLIFQQSEITYQTVTGLFKALNAK